MKTIDTLIDDMYSVLSNGPHGDAVNEAIMFSVTDLKEHYVQRYANKPDVGERLRMSNLGKPCDLEKWMLVNKGNYKTEPLKPELLNVFAYGHLLESHVLLLARLAGHSVRLEQHEVTLKSKLVEGFQIEGHIDGVVDGVLLDAKSASDYTYGKFENHTLEQDDLFGYLTQINGYHYCMRKEFPNTLDPDRLGFLAVNKSNGKMCLDMYQPWSDDQFESTWEKLALIVNNKERPQKIPPVPEGKSGNMKLSTPCKFCNKKWECYPNMRVFKYANGESYLTTVAREPNVEDVTQEYKI